MKVLVIGGTGTVGSQLVQTLLGRKADVRVMTTSAESAKRLPAGVESIIGDLANKVTLASAFKGIERKEDFVVLNADGSLPARAAKPKAPAKKG